MPSKKKNEIFETDEVDDVGENEIVEEPAIDVPEEPVKKVRKKRVLSEEQKERLRAQLAVGRATSLANRRKKKQLTEMAKEKQKEAKDEELMAHLESKKLKGNLAKENERLRLKLKDLESQKRENRPDTPPPKKEPEPEPIKKMVTIKEEIAKPVVAKPVQPRQSLLPMGLKLSDIYRM